MNLLKKSQTALETSLDTDIRLIFAKIPADLITKFQVASAGLTEAQNSLNNLIDRQALSSKVLPGLETEAENLKIRKAALLAKSLDIDNAGFQLHREEQVKNSIMIENERDLQDALRLAIEKTTGAIRQMNEQKTSARTKLWQSVSALATEEIRARSQTMFFLLDASARLSGADRAGMPFEVLHQSLAVAECRRIESLLLEGIC